MKLKSISLALIFLIILPLTHALDDYSIKVNLQEKLKDGQTYECKYKIDNQENTLKAKYPKQAKPIERDISKSFSIACNTKVDRIILEVLKDDKVVKTAKDIGVSSFSYNLAYNTAKIETGKDCAINTNGVIETIKYKKSKGKIESTFFDIFTLSCKTPQITEVTVTDINGKELFWDKINTSYFVYNSKTKSNRYEYELMYYSDFKGDTNNCILNIDGIKTKITVSKKTRLKDRTKTGQFNKDISFSCKESIEQIGLIVTDKKTLKEQEVFVDKKNLISFSKPIAP